jgi:hypothetical protein
VETLTVGLVGTGVLLAWSALANQNPLDVVRSAFDRGHSIRPLYTKAAESPPPEDADGSAVAAPSGGLYLVELYYRGEAWKNGKRIGAVPDHGGHVHAAAAPGRTWQDVVAYLRSVGITPKVGSTTGGTHVAGSNHYKGRAVDFPGAAGAGSDPELDRIMGALRPLARYG